MGHDFLHATHGANQKCGLRMFTYYAAIVTIPANRPKNLGSLSPPLIYLFIYGHGMLCYLFPPSFRSCLEGKSHHFPFGLCGHWQLLGSASQPRSGTRPDCKSAQHSVADARNLPQHMPDTTYEDHPRLSRCPRRRGLCRTWRGRVSWSGRGGHSTLGTLLSSMEVQLVASESITCAFTSIKRRSLDLAVRACTIS